MAGKKRWKLIQVIGYAISILLVVYVLSIGPVSAKVFNSNGSGGCTFQPVDTDSFFSVENYLTFYDPLLRIVDTNQFLKDSYYHYSLFCRSMLNPSY